MHHPTCIIPFFLFKMHNRSAPATRAWLAVGGIQEARSQVSALAHHSVIGAFSTVWGHWALVIYISSRNLESVSMLVTSFGRDIDLSY